MGQCKYCGEDAGLFSHVHKEWNTQVFQGCYKNERIEAVVAKVATAELPD